MHGSKHKIIIVGHVQHAQANAIAAALAIHASITLHDAQEIVDEHIANPRQYKDLKPQDAFAEPIKIEMLCELDKISPVMLVEKDEAQTHTIKGINDYHGKKHKYKAPRNNYNLRKHQSR